jgi:hypothetical protein
MVELGRIDICLECSMLSSHLVLPRERHLHQVFHVLVYLKKYHNMEIVYDPSDPVINVDDFEQQDWASSEYLNCSLTHWMSRKQMSVESSSFALESFAMKQCCEYLRGLRYKLCMMGIPCEGPVYISCDNQSVLANTTIPNLMLGLFACMS